MHFKCYVVTYTCFIPEIIRDGVLNTWLKRLKLYQFTKEEHKGRLRKTDARMESQSSRHKTIKLIQMNAKANAIPLLGRTSGNIILKYE